MRTKEIGMEARFKELSSERDKISLSVDDLAKVVEIWTGVPASSITEHEFARIDTLGERLREHIIGQDKAVDAVVRAIKRSRAGVSSKRKPVSFIFAGSTGVGKQSSSNAWLPIYLIRLKRLYALICLSLWKNILFQE